MPAPAVHSPPAARRPLARRWFDMSCRRHNGQLPEVRFSVLQEGRLRLLQCVVAPELFSGTYVGFGKCVRAQVRARGGARLC